MAPEDTSRTSASAPPDDSALRAIAEGVESETGDKFFSSLARSLALALGVPYAFVSRLSDDGKHFKVLALWERDHFGPSIELPLTGTPCECVLRGERDGDLDLTRGAVVFRRTGARRFHQIRGEHERAVVTDGRRMSFRPESADGYGDD